MISADIAAYLTSQGLGTLGVDYFDVALPANIDNAVMVRDYPGSPPFFDHDQPTPALIYPRVQIVARNLDVVAAYTASQAAFSAIHGIKDIVIDGTTYLRAEALQAPFWLQQDSSDRHYVVFNAHLIVAG